MKNFFKVFILIAGFVLYFNANSFATVSVAAYGGYSFGRLEFNSLPDEEDLKNIVFIKGPQFGLKSHYNIELTPSIDLGLGAFFQYTRFKYYDYDGKALRTAAGLDVNFVFSTPSDFYPYVVVNYSLYDKLDLRDMGDEKISGHGVGIGCGLEYGISSNVRLSAEMMHEMLTYKKHCITMVYNGGLKILF